MWGSPLRRQDTGHVGSGWRGPWLIVWGFLALTEGSRDAGGLALSGIPHSAGDGSRAGGFLDYPANKEWAGLGLGRKPIGVKEYIGRDPHSRAGKEPNAI